MRIGSQLHVLEVKKSYRSSCHTLNFIDDETGVPRETLTCLDL